MNDDTPIAADTSRTGTSGAEVLLNLEQLVKSHITSIDSIKVELKKNREMLDDVLNNDATYKAHSEKAKEAAKVRAATKSQILKNPSVLTVSEKVKEMRTDLKDKQTALSDYLREYQRMSGSSEITGEDGEVREIVYVAKLVKRSSRQVK